LLLHLLVEILRFLGIVNPGRYTEHLERALKLLWVARGVDLYERIWHVCEFLRFHVQVADAPEQVVRHLQVLSRLPVVGDVVERVVHRHQIEVDEHDSLVFLLLE